MDNFIIQGDYKICGNRSNSSDGLPTTDTGNFTAQLTVLVSGNNVMQKLMMLGPTTGNLYMRMKQGAAWDTWKTLF